MNHTVYISGIPNWPDVNVRSSAGLIGTAIVYRAPKGFTAIASEVVDDPNNDSFNGQTYRWFKLNFINGKEGWVRDDLIELEGDFNHVGYGFQPLRILAFNATIIVNPGPSTHEDPAKCSAFIPNDLFLGVNVRALPTSRSATLVNLTPNTMVGVIGVEDGIDDDYRWVNIRHETLVGYIREDLLEYENCADLGLPKKAEQPLNPEPPSGGEPNPAFRFDGIIKGFYAVTSEFEPAHHDGMDLAGNEGIGIYASGTGTVIRVNKCDLCTVDKPSALHHGHSRNDPDVIDNPKWGWGYGTFAYVRYAWNDLPTSTRQYLIGEGLEGVYAYVVYAHLASLAVNKGDPVNKDDKIGTLGNTGNSTGPHLHLEVVVSTDSNKFSLAGLRRIDPRQMFTI